MAVVKGADQPTAETVLTALRRTRQVRRFSAEPVAEADLQAILEVARWSGSSINRQPWSFIVVRRRADLERLAELAPYAKHVAGAAVAIAIAMGGDNPEWDAYDEGRVAERILIAAGALGYGAAIGWAIENDRPRVAEFLRLSPPAGRRNQRLGRPEVRSRTSSASCEPQSVTGWPSCRPFSSPVWWSPATCRRSALTSPRSRSA